VQAGGHPFLLHSICRLLFRRSEERNHAGPVTEHDFTAIQPAIVEQADEIFDPLWQSASRNERLVMLALHRLGALHPQSFEQILEWLTTSGYELNSTQLAAALRSLEYKGLVRINPDRQYQVTMGMFDDWVETNITPTLLTKPQRPQPANRARTISIIGLVVALLIVGGVAFAAISGILNDNDDDEAAPPSIPTATLAINIEATRQSDSATRTQRAIPTLTPTRTDTPTLTLTPTASDTPTRTPRPSQTPSAQASETTMPTQPPTNTQRPSRTPTLAPG
jgi:hypothetical protein